MDKKSEKGVRELFGASLKNVREGERILSYMEKLIAERDALEERQKHLTSLTRLFEKTICEADEMAAQIKKEAEEKAKAEAEAILGQADEKIEQIMKEKKLEAVKIAEEKVQEIRAKCEGELEIRLNEKKAALQALFRDYSERLYNEMLKQMESFKQHAAQLETDIARSLAELNVSDHMQSPGGNEDNLESLISFDSFEDNLVAQPPGNDGSGNAIADMVSDGLERVEFEILPPRDKEAMEEIASHFSGMEEVKAVDLRHLTDMTIVEMVLNRGIDLVKTLSELPQVEKIQEVEEKGQKKIQIILTVHGELEKARDVLNTRANRIASREASLT